VCTRLLTPLTIPWVRRSRRIGDDAVELPADGAGDAHGRTPSAWSTPAGVAETHMALFRVDRAHRRGARGDLLRPRPLHHGVPGHPRRAAWHALRGARGAAESVTTNQRTTSSSFWTVTGSRLTHKRRRARRVQPSNLELPWAKGPTSQPPERRSWVSQERCPSARGPTRLGP